MFTNDRWQADRTGQYETPRQQHFHDLVTKFRAAKSEEGEKTATNLANVAFDPYNFVFPRQLNLLELFIDCLTELNEGIIELDIDGICNAVADAENAKIVADCGVVPALTECLLRLLRNTVKYAIGGLYYLLDSGRCDRREILKADVVELIRKYAEAGGGGAGFGNLAGVLLDKQCAE